LRQLPTLDMMVELQNTLNHRLSLDSIATATFGVEKTAEGLQAIRWFKDGRLAEIAEYCCYDVKITKLVHEYGQQHRQLHYSNRFGKKMTVPVSWLVLSARCFFPHIITCLDQRPRSVSSRRPRWWPTPIWVCTRCNWPPTWRL
jgi:hypothetical protein